MQTVPNDFLKEYSDVLKPEDLQKILHIGRNKIYEFLKCGVIKSVRIGNTYRIPKLYIWDYLYGGL